MSVHIDELHTDVTPAGGSSGGRDDRGAGGRETVEEQVARARRRADWVAARVAAEGFDD